MKIDANSDGTVDWEEFTNHLLLEQIAADGNEDLKAGFYSKVFKPSILKSFRSIFATDAHALYRCFLVFAF